MRVASNEGAYCKTARANTGRKALATISKHNELLETGAKTISDEEGKWLTKSVA